MGKFLEVAAERPRGLNWEVMNLATHTGVVKGDATTYHYLIMTMNFLVFILNIL